MIFPSFSSIGGGGVGGGGGKRGCGEGEGGGWGEGNPRKDTSILGYANGTFSK